MSAVIEAAGNSMARIGLDAPPQPWEAAQMAADDSWVRHLSAQAISGVQQALAHARSVDKPLLEMTAADFPLNAAAARELAAAFDATQKGWGLCLLRGFPVRAWTEADTRLAYWGIGLHAGVARTQNKASDILNDVRDEGGSYKVTGGRGYNTNARLDFHIDFCDVVALMCRRVAKSGGMSLISSSLAVVREIERNHPHLREALYQPIPFSWQGTQAPGHTPTYLSPMAGTAEGFRAFRTNRKNIVAAQRDFPDAPRLTPAQEELVALVDTLLADPRFCYSMHLHEGDMQLLNNYVIVHSRTDFEDHAEADEKRHLLRLWLSVPGSQPLPESWLQAFKDVRPGAVRGGTRGSGITAEFLAYEARQADALGMANVFAA